MEPLKYMEVRWAFTGDQFSIYDDFVKNTLNNGESHFLLKTYSISPIPGFMRQVDQECSIVEAKDSFVRSDNLYMVIATLQIHDTNVSTIPKI